MKKCFNSYRIFLVMTAVFLLVSCDDLFNEVPIDKLDESAIWGNELLLEEYEMPWYREMSFGFSTFVPTNGLLKNIGREYIPWFGDQMTVSKADWYSADYGNILKSSMQDMTNKSRMLWSYHYKQIQSINLLLENETEIPSGEFKNRILGEAHFFKAYYYYSLWRRFGGVLLIDKKTDPLIDKIKYPRASYEEMVNYIVSEATQAANLLPSTYPATHAGRVTKGAALMLKAKAYFWASGVKFQNRTEAYLGFPDEKSNAMLAQAALAYDDLMKLNYSLVQLPGTTKSAVVGQYRNIFLTKNSVESILEVQHSTDGNFEIGFGHKLDRESVSPYYGGTTAAYVPTHNHVNEYRTADGKMITDPGSGYSITDPYANRDYRFYANILYDGCAFRGRTMNIHYTIQNAKEVAGEDLTPYGASTSAAVSKTGYYLGKFVNESQKIDNDPIYGSGQNYIIWRFAEVLLDYAEIDFKLGRPAAALDKINQIRRRVHMPELLSVTWDDIVNERRVELAFEETTYWDLLRWGIAEQKMTGTSNPLKGIKIVKEEGKPTKYTEMTVNGKNTYVRYFRNLQYYLPLPWDEIKYHAITQNPTWIEM